MFLLALLIVCFASGTISLSIITPCKISDTTCVEKSINSAIPKFLAGNPELGIGSSDPLFVEKIDGDLSILKYTLYNTTQTGYKQCAISNIQLDEDITKLHFDLSCPKITLTGKYESKGRLIILPVEGKGDYTFSTGKYFVNVDSELNKVQGSDGKTHLAIKNFKINCTALEPIQYDFKNLFNGQKDLSDAVHKFALENWKEVADLVQAPTWYACLKKMIGNINKYLKHIALEDIVLK